MLSHKFKSAKLSYGWIIVGVSVMILFAAFGIRLSFTVYFVALIDDFGWGDVGPLGAVGWLFDVSGSYGTTVWLAIGVVLVSTVALTAASRYVM